MQIGAARASGYECVPGGPGFGSSWIDRALAARTRDHGHVSHTAGDKGWVKGIRVAGGAKGSARTARGPSPRPPGMVVRESPVLLCRSEIVRNYM